MKYEKLVLIEIYVKTAIVLMESVPTFLSVVFVIREGAENRGGWALATNQITASEFVRTPQY